MIKFEVDPTETNRQLFYSNEDHSFYVEPLSNVIDFDLLVNYISLTIVNHKMDHVSGLCPYSSWIKANYDVPKYREGAIKVKTDFDPVPGVGYRINDDVEWPAYVNIESGWVCIGDPKKAGEAIEFMKNCIAVIVNGDLVALWLKPHELPRELLH